ncbi:MAG: hypothetical protein LW809_04515 [Vampirovibrionales bacterium]|jgi:hypothetical protein|nr:hypothetical protein [Vampirovibrionales bacterium]
MMMPNQSPYNSNGFVDALNHFYYNNVKSIPTKGTHFADRLNAQARNTSNPASKAVQMSTAKMASLFTDSVEFAKFEKTPELFGATIPKLPLTFLILMFFGSMTPARMHSEYLRAPKVDEDGDGEAEGHDYRAIRDVLIRDVTSISLFLFALEPVKHAMLAKKQKDGTLFSFGKSAKHTQLMLMHGGLNPRKPGHSISYPELEEIYNLTPNAPETLAKLAAMHKSNNNLAKPMEDYLQAYPLWQKNNTAFLSVLNNPNASADEKAEAHFMLQMTDALKSGGRKVITHTQELSTAKTHLRTHFYDAINGLAPDKATNTMRRATLNADPHTLIRRLFELKGLEKNASIEELSLKDLKGIVASDLDNFKEKIQQQALLGELPKEKAYLKAATHTPDYTTFKGHLDLAMQKGDFTAFNFMADQAMNYQHFIDVCTKKVMASHPKSKDGKPLSYSHVFNTLKNEHFAQLEDSVAALRAGQNLLDVLNTPHGESVLKHFKGMYTHSANAMKEVDALDATLKRLQKEGATYLKSSFNFLGTKVPLPAVDWAKNKLKMQTLQSLDVRRILSESARNMRSPVDSIGYVLVAAVIGFFPVWLNQVVTETEYRFKKAKDAPPKSEDAR